MPVLVYGDGDDCAHTDIHGYWECSQALSQTGDRSGGLVQKSVDGMHVSQMTHWSPSSRGSTLSGHTVCIRDVLNWELLVQNFLEQGTLILFYRLLCNQGSLSLDFLLNRIITWSP